MRLLRLENHYTSPETSPQTSPDASPGGNDPDTRLSDEVFAPASWDHQRIHGTDEENDKPSAVDMTSASCEAAPPEDGSRRFIPQFPWVSTGNPLVGATITSFSADSAGFRGAPDPLGTMLWVDESSDLEDWFTTPGPLTGPGCEQLSLAGPCESPVGKKVIAIENHCFGKMGRPVWLGDPRGQWCTRECQMDESSEPLTTGPVVFLEGGGCFFSVGSNGNECMPGPLAVILAIGDMGPMYDVGQLVGPAYDPAYNE